MSVGNARPAHAWGVLLALMLAPALPATDLNLKVQSAGSSTVTVLPGAAVSYAVVGELSDALNEGLALFAFDLHFSGGPLAPANAPASSPLLSFAVPAGINNPAGFGGTPVAGALLQVGGAQNTLNNSFAPYPLGSVTTGVALPGFAATLVSGQLTAPLTPGSYMLTPSGLVANVIQAGASGVPVWKVESAVAGTLLPLTVIVQSSAAGAPGRSARKTKS